MRTFAPKLSATLVLAAMVLPASAEIQLSVGASPINGSRPANATMIAKHIKCGGPDLQCGPDLAQVCNLRTNKCCCLKVGTYH
jgi:hypothetical protein